MLHVAVSENHLPTYAANCSTSMTNHAKQSSVKPGNRDEIIARRAQHLGLMCTVFFKQNPINVVRASGQYLFDENDQKYLDCISNVQHVGHCHPVVAKAISDQLTKNTCNSRFLNENLVICCEKLKATMPADLDTVFFCNSGSEANDLALRISYNFTEQADDIIVIDHAYHGHVTSLIDISPYKFNGVGGRGKPDHVHIAPCPDIYRGVHRLSDDKLKDFEAQKEAGRLYAEDVRKIYEKCKAEGRRVRAFIMESLQSCGGQVIPPPGYVELVQKYTHEAGAIFIADEVQTGFGRIGHNYWAFQLHNDKFTPDIVTIGKPIGNGFPVSALITKREIAKKFGGGMQYFNTFGGNPVACVAVVTVMKVIEDDKLMQNAIAVGDYLLKRLQILQKEFPSLIGDVRGVGLFVGIDIVDNPVARTPSAKEANWILAKMRDRNIILSTDGPYENVIKMKPPMCFSMQNADEVVDNLRCVIMELVNSNK